MGRLPANDPRTIARDIPGILDAIFPQLTPGVVAHFNREAVAYDECLKLTNELVDSSALSRAMLFEIAFARGEQLLHGSEVADWDRCLEVAVERQQRHFDAQIPEGLVDADKAVAEQVANNMAAMLRQIEASEGSTLSFSPRIPGFQWIASGVGDFSVGPKLIEVKCTNKRFSASDYRQVLMYWLLSFASAIENETFDEWTAVILINPRQNYVLDLSFNGIIEVAGVGRSKIEILELFASMIGDYSFRMQESVGSLIA